ncbi:hypothetical protein WA171_004428, partial [Blastocystis sp. BT1]
MSISKFGYVAGCMFLLLFAILSAVTCYLLSQIYYYTGSTTYAGMGKELFGKSAESIINFIQVLYGLGALFSYTIVAADESHYVMEHFIRHDPSSWIRTFMLDRSSLLIVISIIFILPPALLPRMDHLRFTSFVSIGAITYLIMALFFHVPTDGACSLADTATYICSSIHQCVIEQDPMKFVYDNLTTCMEMCEHCPVVESSHHFKAFTFTAGAFFSLPFFCFSSTCQVQFVPILAEMKEPTKKNVITVLNWSFITIAIIYVLAGTTGYYSFCGYITNNVLDSFPVEDISIMICRVAIVISMCFSIPLFSHPLRFMILDLIGVKEKKYWMIALITIMIVVVDTIVAIIAKNLGTVLGITGAIGSSTIMMILPSIMFFQYLRKTQSKRITLDILSILIFIMGLTFGTLGTIATI